MRIWVGVEIRDLGHCLLVIFVRLK
jgi:hypothetical protein